jgi:GT2 family glycosyltransferase
VNAPRVSVVVATRDRAALLGRTLEQLTEDGRTPVLVVDNASSDGTAALVASRFPGVRLLRLSANRGALARNHGVRAATTPYVAFSDDDSWWEPGALERAAGLLDRHPRLGLVAAGVRVGDHGGRRDPLEHTLAASPLGTAPDLPGRRVLGFLGCAAVVRRSAFLEAGGYHPVLFFGAEETLLACDLAARGWGVTFCPEVVARHAPAAGPRAGRVAVMRRNALLTAWLRRPLPVALRRTAALAADARRDADARDALSGALLRLPAALRDRRLLPSEVEMSLRRLEGA